jgi:hypothetical protein
VLGVTETLVPVPDKLTVCGLPLALSVMVRVPEAAPAAVGVNVTLIAHEVPAAMPVPQVLVWPKTALLTVMLVKVKVAVPVLLTVTGWAALAIPTPLEKVRLLTERLAAGVPVEGGVVLDPPPQQVKRANPTSTAKKRLKFAAERDLGFIAPPPA